MKLEKQIQELREEVERLKMELKNKQDKPCDHIYPLGSYSSGGFTNCTKCGACTYINPHAGYGR
jgi:hypothetical protein